MCFTRERTFFPALWANEFCDKAAKTSKKNPNAPTKIGYEINKY